MHEVMEDKDPPVLLFSRPKDPISREDLIPKLRQLLALDGTLDRTHRLAENWWDQIENETPHESRHPDPHLVSLRDVIQRRVSLRRRLPRIGVVIERQRPPRDAGWRTQRGWVAVQRLLHCRKYDGAVEHGSNRLALRQRRSIPQFQVAVVLVFPVLVQIQKQVDAAREIVFLQVIEIRMHL